MGKNWIIAILSILLVVFIATSAIIFFWEGAESIEDVRACTEEVTYTQEQIEAALEPQFQIGMGESTFISAQRVERDRDSMILDSSPTPIDLSESVRYRVTYEIRIPLDETDFRISDEYRIENGYIIYTVIDYFYFNDENGTPVLVVVRC